MIEKQCQFSGKDGEGVYFNILRPGYSDSIDKIKLASASPPLLEEIQAFLKNGERDDGRVWALVSALGAGEYWSSNSNADFFPESALIHTPEGWHDLGHKMQKMVGRSWEWGFPTFYNAYAYQHHRNKDPSRAFGTVEYVAWDPKMKRVLLVVAIDRKKATEFGAQGIVDKIENGEYPDLSMGCKVPFDACSVCSDWSRITGNPKKDLAEHRRSPIRGLSVTTADYCQHLRFESGQIYPDGRKVWMWNFHPKFFDISFVFIGADKTSKLMAKLSGHCPLRPDQRMCAKGCWECDIPSSHVHDVWDRPSYTEPLSKVAHEFPEWEDDWVSPQKENKLESYFSRKRGAKKGQYVDSIDTTSPASGASKLAEIKEAFTTGATKLADLDLAKKAEIIKRIQSHFNTALPAIESNEPPIPKDVLDEMACAPGHGLGTATGMGIILRPREFQRVRLLGMGRGDLADDLDERGICFHCGRPMDGARNAPDIRNGLDLRDVIPKIVAALSPLMEGRSAFARPLMRRSMSVIVVSKPRDEGEHIDHPLLDKLSHDYAEYRRAVMYKVAEQVPRVLHEFPHLWESTMDSDPFSGSGPGIVKTSEDVIQSVLGMFPAMYLNRAYLPGPASEYIASRPSFAGLREAGALAVSGGVA